MARYKLQLKEYTLSSQMFYEILARYEDNIKRVPDLSYLMYGYEDKHTIYYCDSMSVECKRFICLERCLVNYVGDNEDYKGWRQVICTLDKDLEGIQVNDTLTGLKAKNIINKILRDYYDDDEIEERLNMFTLDNPTKDQKQVHILYDSVNELVKEDTIYKIDNVIKYDLNGAHLDALCEIFPRAKQELNKCYLKRKIDKKWKSIPNFYVGMLVYGHRPTYNWIVNRTTQLLNDIINKVGGWIIYANTDGVAIECPAHLLETSTELGGIKEEFKGTAYYLRTKNYYVYQFEKLVGSLRCDLRDKVDLSQGIAIKYDLKVNTIANIRYSEPMNVVQQHFREV